LPGAHTGRAGARARAAAATRPRPAVRAHARAVRRRGGARCAGRPPGTPGGRRRRPAGRGGLMASLTRLRAHAGLWALVVVLAGLAVLVAATAGPLVVRIEDRALQKMVEQAHSYLDRDILAVEPTKPGLMGLPPTAPETLLTDVGSLLAPPLRDVEASRWGLQRTTINTFGEIGATVTGDGVVAAPHGYAPVVALLFQPDLERDVHLLSGRPPVTSPADGVVEVMVAADVARALGLQVGGEYLLHPGVVVNEPDAGPSLNALALR